MQEIKSIKTYAEIDNFRRVASMRIQRENEVKEKSKLSECIHELIGNPLIGELGSFAFLQERYKKAQRTIFREFAAVDENGILKKDANNNYCYTKEAEVLCEEKLETLKHEMVEFTPVYCPAADLPRDLLSIEKEAYRGFVIAAE